MLLMTSVLYGPCTEYRPFIEFINLQGDCAKMSKFSNFGPALWRFTHTLCCIGVVIGLGTICDHWYLTRPDFASEPMYFKSSFLILSMHVKMFTLFSGFTSQEANLIAGGYGYIAKTEKEPE